MSNTQLLAFVHIEKAAGTTFASILQHNYLFRHCNVKTLTKDDKGIFSSNSLKIVFRINPFVRSISGHSVMPYNNLNRVAPDIRYITILREPIARYISHYQHQVEVMGSTYTFEDFLDAEFTHNFQTIKIAGAPDIEKAKSILRGFFLVGILEEFDNFLTILQKKLIPKKFNIHYQSKNVAKTNKVKKSILENLDKYSAKIESRNHLDLELYDYVKNILFSGEKSLYLPDAPAKHITRDAQALKVRLFLYRIYTKVYYSQMIKFYRLKNGLPSRGAY